MMNDAYLQWWKNGGMSKWIKVDGFFGLSWYTLASTSSSLTGPSHLSRLKALCIESCNSSPSATVMMKWNWNGEPPSSGEKLSQENQQLISTRWKRQLRTLNLIRLISGGGRCRSFVEAPSYGGTKHDQWIFKKENKRCQNCCSWKKTSSNFHLQYFKVFVCFFNVFFGSMDDRLHPS